ncbi:uncharacterized protein LAESUDRAFT_755524 [Laetiporus sulphureus 93-53]|uniref:Uncharacterized protein n=1 Tax=Laetiporus sulphureus 93-53 TaxID=1314785 RepID=A0A165GVE4_9APHY|nr:uncharacterized protein LAESUDRAFT_755524 [Laetiporus sulphureus 93-53]KZT10872.1 hypothetical protein LAESUDRAFT_755524 [Laetiporus sulphureus 93-53]
MSPLPTNGAFHVIGPPFLHGRSAVELPMIQTAALAAGAFWFDGTASEAYAVLDWDNRE